MDDLGIAPPEFLLDNISLDEGPDGMMVTISYAYYSEIQDQASNMHSCNFHLDETTDPDGRLRELMQQVKDNAEEIISEQATYLRTNQ